MPSASDAPADKKRYFFGWNIVIACVLSQVAYFEHVASSLGLFFRPLQTEFGWSRTSLGGVQTTGRLVEGLAAPIVGPLIDRYGARVVMPIGGILLTISMLATTRVNVVWQMYLLRGVLAGIGFTFIGDIVTGVSISKWFVKKRGRALGYSRTASAVSGIVLMPLIVYTIASMGWRKGFVLFAILAFAFSVLPPIFLMRRNPEDLGLRPDGAGAPSAGKENQTLAGPPDDLSSEPVWKPREVLATPVFWMVTAAFTISAMAWQGLNVSLPSYIQDLGYSTASLSAIMSANFMLQAIGAFLMGYVSERAHRADVRMGPMILQSLGTAFLLFGRNPACLWIGVVLYRFGVAATLVIQEVVWANFFGRRSLGVVRSIGYFLVFVPGAMGPVLLNMAYDATGSYRSAFLVMVAMFAVSALLLGAARPPRAKPSVQPALAKGGRGLLKCARPAPADRAV